MAESGGEDTGREGGEIMPGSGSGSFHIWLSRIGFGFGETREERGDGGDTTYRPSHYRQQPSLRGPWMKELVSSGGRTIGEGGERRRLPTVVCLMGREQSDGLQRDCVCDAGWTIFGSLGMELGGACPQLGAVPVWRRSRVREPKMASASRRPEGERGV